MSPGDTFYWDPGQTLPHLWIVLHVGPDESGIHSALVVNMTSLRPGGAGDRSCVLQPGEHPFVSRPTILLYAYACRRPLTHFAAFPKGAPLSATLTARAIGGAAASPFLKRKFKALLSV